MGGLAHGANTKHERGETRGASAHLEQLPQHPGDLQELVLLALLESHERAGRLLWVLGVGEDAPHPLLRLHVARLLEEPHERVLVDVLEDVAHGLLAVRRVEPVAVDRGADPAALGGRVAGHVAVCVRELAVSRESVWPLRTRWLRAASESRRRA